MAFNYIAHEFKKLQLKAGDCPLIKFNNDGKEIFWLSVSPKVVAKIQSLLELEEATSAAAYDPRQLELF